MKQNYKFTISYDGSRYYGWEHQPNTDLTIQGKIETVLTKMVNSDNIIEINKTAFKGCISLENITLRNSVKIIGESAFENCQKLVSINNWDNVESISKNAFFAKTTLA